MHLSTDRKSPHPIMVYLWTEVLNLEDIFDGCSADEAASKILALNNKLKSGQVSILTLNKEYTGNNDMTGEECQEIRSLHQEIYRHETYDEFQARIALLKDG